VSSQDRVGYVLSGAGNGTAKGLSHPGQSGALAGVSAGWGIDYDKTDPRKMVVMNGGGIFGQQPILV
jgi:hypothetical protein